MMTRTRQVCLVAASIAISVLAPYPAMATTDDAQPTIEVDATSAPTPSLRFRLRLSGAERQAGNAATHYLRAVAGLPKLDGDQAAQLESLYGESFDHMPLSEAQEILATAWGGARQPLEDAIKRDTCSWEIPFREHGVATLLPELGRMRTIGRLLALQSRVDRRAGADEQTIMASLRAGLILSQHLCEGETLIHNLVGLAVASRMLEEIESWVGQGGAPSLYWALAEFPFHELSVRRGFDAEFGMIESAVPTLAHVESLLPEPGASFDLASWNSIQNDLETEIAGAVSQAIGGPALHPMSQWMLVGLAITGYPDAHAHFLEQGHSRLEVDAWPVTFVSLAHTIHQYRVIRDDLYKWVNQPYWIAGPAMSALELSASSGNTPASRFFFQLLPSLSRAALSEARLQRRANALMIIEAIRLHATRNDGRLPGSLTDVSIVPIPHDPVTGRAFQYEVNEGVATLSSGDDPAPGQANLRVYHISMRSQ